MIDIVKSHIPIDHYHRDGVKLRKFKGVTIHETGNPSKGSNVDAHILYIHNLVKSGNKQYIGYHLFVDDTKAGEVVPLDERVWINGDGEIGTGNNETISIELCVNCDGDFAKTRSNGAWLAAYVLCQHGVKTVVDGLKDKVNGNLFQHYSWSGKNCPQTIREKGLWDEFVQATQKYLNELNGVAASKEYHFKINTTFNNGVWNSTQKMAQPYLDNNASSRDSALKIAVDFYIKNSLGSEYKIFDTKDGNVVYPIQNNESENIKVLMTEIEGLKKVNDALTIENKELKIKVEELSQTVKIKTNIINCAIAELSK